MAEALATDESPPEQTPVDGRGAAPILYLLSRYPAISHTFVLREVTGLRALGFTIAVASINPPDRSQAELDERERAEAALTFCVKRAGAVGALAAIAGAFVRRPRRCLGMFGTALGRAGSDPKRLLKALFYAAEAALVAREAERRGARAIHVHFANPASVVGSLAARLLDVPFSFTVHGSPPFHDEPGDHFPAVAADAHFVCCIGAYSRSQVMLRMPPDRWDRIEITRMGVDLARFRPPAERATREIPELVCVARLDPVKGHRLLLAAARRLVDGGRRFVLRLVGDGPEREALASLLLALGLEGHVRLEGAASEAGVQAAYARADVFVLASLTEGVPVVLMEAMAMELPCVAPRLAGIPELVRDGIDGLLFTPSDELGLAAALEQLLDDADARRRLGVSGRRRVAEGFDLATTTGLMAGVLARRLGSRRAGHPT
ncbi:MAG: glycosyltransferase [Planctomycetes bacterium]|nr:glycosyltransferase [Planctomycetota bacterium]